MKGERIVYRVEADICLGRKRAYRIVYSRNGNNFAWCHPSGRLGSWRTMSGAIRKCDELNAAEHKRVIG